MAGFDSKNVIGLIQSSVEERFANSWAAGLSIYNGQSDRAIEEYGIFGGYSKMREWVGARQANEIAQKNHEIRNRKYESTLVVGNDLLSRDKSGLLDAHINQWVDGTINYHWEDLVVSLINDAGTKTGFDGKTFFATDHQFGSETQQKNTIVAGDVPDLNVTTPTAPTAEEMAKVVMGMVGWMLTLKDDKDRYVNGSARNFTVQVATIPLWSALTTALNSNIITGVVDNPMNGLKLGGFNFKPLFTPELTSATTKVRMYRTDGAVKPFILQEERGVEYKELGAGSDFEFENDAIKFGVQTNRGAGYGDWKQALEATLS
jgi:hypothetical protein